MSAETPRRSWRVLDLDRRTLGFTRILIGFLLLTDLAHRWGSWLDMYASSGVVPPALNLERPLMGDVVSLFNAFSSPSEHAVLRALMLVAFACLTAGYRTRLAHLVSLALVIAMNARRPPSSPAHPSPPSAASPWAPTAQSTSPTPPAAAACPARSTA